MDLFHIILLVVAGIAGGIISSLVGGAALVTYPALLSIGLPPVIATVCNLVALTPGNFLAALYDRGQLPPFDRAFVGLVVASLVGALFGAGLLLVTPERIFSYFIPVLMAFATVLFAFAGYISAWLRKRAAGQGTARWSHSMGVIFPVSFYGGYFGAGVGVLLIGVLSIGTGGDYRSANTTKNLVTSLNSFVAAAVSMSQGAVRWTPTLLMMAGALVGAMIGARLAQVVPHAIMRIAVTVVGALLTIAFAWRYWF
ncbi:MAG: sulfite exporter TauE/SafE family protein [Xanthobacteraceae bacterium]